VDLLGKPPGYYNVEEYVIQGVASHALEFMCPCGCGNESRLHLVLAGEEKKQNNWLWDGNPHQPTLSPSIRRTMGCLFHGYLEAGVWRSAGDGASIALQVYRGGPDHPVEPRRILVPNPTPIGAPAPAPAPAPARAAAPAGTLRPTPAGPSAARTLSGAPKPPAPAAPPAGSTPPGYTKTMNLRMKGGKLQQEWLSGHSASAPSYWIDIQDADAVAKKAAPAPAPAPAAKPALAGSAPRPFARPAAAPAPKR
jgi:hypothetical protein